MTWICWFFDTCKNQVGTNLFQGFHLCVLLAHCSERTVLEASGLEICFRCARTCVIVRCCSFHEKGMHQKIYSGWTLPLSKLIRDPMSPQLCLQVETRQFCMIMVWDSHSPVTDGFSTLTCTWSDGARSVPLCGTNATPKERNDRPFPWAQCWIAAHLKTNCEGDSISWCSAIRWRRCLCFVTCFIRVRVASVVKRDESGHPLAV